MSVMNDIIFMVGCPRSGTTILNHLIRDELGVGFSNELQLIPKYYKKMSRYGDLHQQKNIKNLVDHVLQEPYFKIFETSYSERFGRHLRITESMIFENLPEPSLAGVVYAVLKATADQLGKGLVGNKHLSMGVHLDWLEEMFPNVRIIHVIRDGRDCCLSLKRMRWGHANAFAAARLWREHVVQGRAFAAKHPQRCVEVRYEDFLEDPEKEMGRLDAFLNGGAPGDRPETRFRTLRSMVRKGNGYKWKKSMKPKDIAIFQAVASDQLKECGYEVSHVEKPIGFLESSYYLFENRLLREYKYRFRKDMPA